MKESVKETEQENQNQSEGIPLTMFLGLIILVGGLFNVPAILKKPATDAEWMMLVIVAAMLLSGLLLIFLPKVIKRKP